MRTLVTPTGARAGAGVAVRAGLTFNRPGKWTDRHAVRLIVVQYFIVFLFFVVFASTFVYCFLCRFVLSLQFIAVGSGCTQAAQQALQVSGSPVDIAGLYVSSYLCTPSPLHYKLIVFEEQNLMKFYAFLMCRQFAFDDISITYCEGAEMNTLLICLM